MPRTSDYMPDILATEDGMKWEDFRRRVSRNCGAYLKSKGAKGLRDIMDDDIAVSMSRRRRKTDRRRKKIDDFFEQLKTPIDQMKKPKP